MPIVATERVSLVHGDCLASLQMLAPCSIDSVVTDPPYEIGFMNKGWDTAGISFSVDLWREALRALKPGGHMLAFGGTRTYHRMTCAIEDAGFEIRDSLHWMYGTGFPKSLTANTGMPTGQGTALKPGHEPIVLARKPLDEGTVAANVAKWGTGGLNIDACRINYQSDDDKASATPQGRATSRKAAGDGGLGAGVRDTPRGEFDRSTQLGRWPANALLDEDAATELDAQTGHLKRGGTLKGGEGGERSVVSSLNLGPRTPWIPYGDSGGASRFFFVAKPGRKERDQGCEHLPPKTGGEATDRKDGSKGTQNPRAGAGRNGGARNGHPTVKPVTLMRYLVRLITPSNGLVLDPFVGSGTTGMAALLEGVRFIGIDCDLEYLEIAKARITHVGI